MIGGQSTDATPGSRAARHDILPPVRAQAGPLSSRVAASSWTWKLWAAFTAVGVQVVLFADSGNGLSTAAPASDRLPLASASLAAAAPGRAMASTLPGTIRLPRILSPDGTAPAAAPLVRIGEQAMPPATEVQSRINSCLAEPSAGNGRAIAALQPKQAPERLAGAGQPVDAPLPGQLPDDGDGRASTNCALLMGLILLGASEPALRYRGTGFRGPLSLP